MRGLWLAACLGACFSPAAPLGAPCSDTQECPAGQTCDLVTNTCSLPTERIAWRDDAAEDFAQGTYLDEVTVESQGFLGPVAYYTGGLRVTGIESAELDNPDNADFEDLDTGELRNVQVIHGVDVDYGAGTPPGFGFSRADDLTILVEGELELEVAGTWRFQLTANDAGFIDLAAPGTHDFERVISDDNSTTVKAFNAPVAGWYQFRAAFTDRAMAMAFQLRYDPPNVQGNGFRAIPSDRLRARAGDITGLVVEGFEESFFIGHRATVVSDVSIADQQYATNPLELPIGTGSYSLRWTGQFLIDMPGDYAFSIDSRDGHRVWIDGAMVTDKLLTSPQLTITPAVELAAGWHDLVIDTHKVGGLDDAHMAFTVETGPAFVGEAFPADHVRPVIGRIGRFASAFALPGLDVPDGASLLTTVAMDLPAEFAAIRADAGFQVDHPVLGQLSVLLDPPAGANITLASVGEILGTGSTFRHEAIPLDRLGGSFAFTTSDALADGVTGTLNAAGVTAIGNGGVAPFPLRYVYESAIHDLGEVAALGSMTWGLRQQSAITTAIVRLRTCDHEADCGDEDWTEVAFDTVPGVAPRRFAQYQLEVTTNGDVPTAVDFVDLAYSRFAP